MQIGDTLFNQVCRFRLVVDIGGILQRNMEHLANTGDDSCALSAF